MLLRSSFLSTQLTLYCYGRSPGKGLQGLFVLRNESSRDERSRERKFQGANGPGNECSRERIVLRTNVPDTPAQGQQQKLFIHIRLTDHMTYQVFTNVYLNILGVLIVHNCTGYSGVAPIPVQCHCRK